MRLSLKTTDTVKYSKREMRIFELLSKANAKRPVSSDQLIKSFYRGKEKEMPFNARNSIVGAVRSLIRKMAKNKETFRIVSTRLRGPQAMEYWIEYN